MMLYGAIFIGGGVGACLRFILSEWVYLLSRNVWLGTLLVNILGCLVFCLIVRYQNHLDDKLLAFVQIGLLGSLTTFSTFNYQVIELLKNAHTLEALSVILLNVLSGILIGAWILR